MSFVKFTGSHKTVGPMVSIYKAGAIGLNKAVLDKYELRKYRYALFYYDKDEQKIGIQFTSKEEAGAYAIRPRSGKAADLSGRAFLQYFEIEHSETKRFMPEWDDRHNMLIIQP